MTIQLLRVLSVLVALLVCLVVSASAAPQVLITMDEYGTVLVTQDGVTRQPTVGLHIAGGGITYRWESFGLNTGDILSGTALLVDADGNVSDSINFHNLGGAHPLGESIDFYSDGTDGLGSPADRLPPLPIDFPFFCCTRIPEVGGEAFYHAGEFGVGSLRNYDTFYHFISDGRIPEPASLLLLVSGFVGLGGMEWRRHRRK